MPDKVCGSIIGIALDLLANFAAVVLQVGWRAGSVGARHRGIVAEANTDAHKKHLRLPEAAFLNSFAVPALYKHLQGHTGLSAAQAKEALLNEYHRSMPEVSAYSPIRATRHPLKKILGSSAETIYKQWKDPEQNFGLTQSAPDFALRNPFPHSIVFEGKFFARGSKEYAARQLVADLYQAFFYRGLPSMDSTNRGHPESDYDYACLLAFDA